MTLQKLSGQQLSEGFSSLVSGPEPPLHLDPQAGIATGRRLVRRRRVVAAVAALGVCAVFGGTAMAVQEYRRPAGNAPIAAAPRLTGPMNILVAGLDAPGPGRRADGIAVVHLDADMKHAYTVSLPRDLYVPIQAGNSHGRKDKINTAFALGGMPGLTATVQKLTGVRIDHTVQVDYAGIRKITDAVGGVDVVVDATSYDDYRFMPANSPYPTTPCRDDYGKRHRCLTFKKGPLHLDGKLAEYYVRQRRGLPAGGLDRVHRHHEYLQALFSKLASTGTLTNPRRLAELVRAVTESVVVDRGMPMTRLALTLKDLRPADVAYTVIPMGDFANVPGVGTVIEINKVKAAELFSAIRADTMADWMRTHPAADVTHGP